MEEFTTVKYKKYDKESIHIEVNYEGFVDITAPIFEEHEYKIDNFKAIKKWRPVLEALKIYDVKENKKYKNLDIDPYGEEDWNEDLDVDPFTLFVAVYAEHHQSFAYNGGINYNDIHRIYPYADPPITGGDIGLNLLPISLKILSKLNLRGKKYEIKTGLKSQEIFLKINRQQLEDIRYATGMDVVQKLENFMVQNLVDKINKELETNNTMYIDTMGDNLTFTASENGLTNLMILRSKYEILNVENDK